MEEKKEKLGFFARLKAGLTKTRKNIVYNIDSVFNQYEEISEEFYDKLEEVLIMGDIGVEATEKIMDQLREDVIDGNYHKSAECKALLIRAIWQQMRVDNVEYKFEEEQSIVMIIGVNGVGKTTTIGKLASKLKSKGKKVVIAAADTFRAAATEQLGEWAKRAGVDMISAHEGADPASVVYDSVQSAKAKNADVLLIDTAGRLHNKKNLMAELEKMNRIIDREFPAAHRENLLVLDATTGQNAIQQAREFATVTPLTGIILTKMDGSAKGGIAVAVQSELKIPVKYIGVGEAIEDLQEFDSARFVDALFEMEGASVSDKKLR